MSQQNFSGVNSTNLGANMQNPYFNQQANSNIGLQNPYMQNVNSSITGTISDMLFGGTNSERFLKGVILGAAATYLMTNEKAQQAIMKAGVKLATEFAGGLAEMKERFEDAKAEAEEEYMQTKEAQ